MEGLALRDFIEELENGPLRRRHGEGPIPLSPRLLGKADLAHGQAVERTRDCFPLEQALDIVKNKVCFEGKFVEPARRFFFTVEMDFSWAAARQIMGETLQFEGRAAADNEPVIEERLQRDDNRLPAQLLIFAAGFQSAVRAAVDAAGDLFEPTVGDVSAAQRARVAVALQPAGVCDQPFWKKALKKV